MYYDEDLNLTDAEKQEIDQYLDEVIEDGYYYDCSDNYRVYQTKEQCEETFGCCGSYIKPYTLSTGREVYIAFDYGH
jgi:hypothetical protein